MKITVFKTPKITSKSHDLFELLDKTLPEIPENSVVAVATKIVSLCEGRVAPMKGTDKDQLIHSEAQKYLPRSGKYGLSFTVTRNIFVPTAGIDESNADGHYILWPVDPQASANAIREYLVERSGHDRIGVVLNDSTTRPMQWGTTGIAIAHSGFAALKDYIGKPDLFGRPMEFQKSNLANGLAAAAVTIMGEGSEQTPLALIEDVDFVDFQGRNPTPKELEDLRIEPEDDLYWPFIKDAPWQSGGKK